MTTHQKFSEQTNLEPRAYGQFARSASRVAFLAALSLYVGSSALAQPPSLFGSFPENEPRPVELPDVDSPDALELNPDLRCFDGPESGSADDCPVEQIDEGQTDAFFVSEEAGYALRFTATSADCSDGFEDCSPPWLPEECANGGDNGGFYGNGGDNGGFYGNGGGEGCFIANGGFNGGFYGNGGGEGYFAVPASTLEGIGVAIADEVVFPTPGGEGFFGSSAIGEDESLLVEVCDVEAGPSSCGNASIPLTGVYLNNVSSDGGFVIWPSNGGSNGGALPQVNGGDNGGGEGFFCPRDRGSVVVETGGQTLEFPWEAIVDGEEGPFGCGGEGSYTLFVPFNDVLDVTSVEIFVDDVAPSFSRFQPEGVFLSALESCDLETTPSGDSLCAAVPLIPPLEPGEEGFVGGDLAVETSPAAGVQVWQDLVYRVIDPRAACQQFAPTGVGAPTESFMLANVQGLYVYDLVAANGVQLIPGLSFNVTGSMPFTIPAKACGVPREDEAHGGPNPNGQIVDRDDPVFDGSGTWTPFFDFVELAANVDPVASITRFTAGGLDAGPGTAVNGGEPYACVENAGMATNIRNVGAGAATLNQPLFMINARQDEIKYVDSTGMIDPVGRDVSVGCGGSKRAISRRYSYLAWNLIHAPEIVLRDETAPEVQTLLDTAARLRACISPTIARSFLDRDPSQIARFYDLGTRLADIGGSRQRLAENYFKYAAVLSTRYRNKLTDNAALIDGFSACYTSLDFDYADVKQTNDPLGTDKPLNAYGDVIAQVEHLRYVFSAFYKELAAPRPPAPAPL